jgi:cytochrome c556
MSLLSKFGPSVAVAALALGTALPAAAQFQKPEDAVKYRQSAMFIMAQHFGRLGAMANGRVPFDAAAAQASADVAVTISRLPFAGFVEGTAGTQKGGASAKIWSERAKFDEAARKMQEEMAKVGAGARNLDSLKAAFGATGQACKACHDDFRNP